MMKKIIFILMCILSVAYGQMPNYAPSGYAGRYFKGNGYISSDSGFFSLFKDTTLKPLSGYWDIKWQGGVPYIWSGVGYSSLSGASGVSSVLGTTNRITSSGGSTPVIDIAATYVGQSSITTLGTIGTGVWNGTAVTVPFGGTGASSFTAGNILYGNGTSAIGNSSLLFWDGANNRLGIGTNAPTSGLTLDSIRSFNNGITLFGTSDQVTNYSKFQIYRTSSNTTVFNLLNGGTGVAGFYDFRVGNTTVATLDASQLNLSSNLFFTGNRDIGRNNASTPFWVRDVYVQRSVIIGAAAGTTITAKLQLGAGTATASTAPLKFTAGTNLTSPEAGTVEFDGTNYFVTVSTTRYTLAKTLTNTASFDFPSVIAGGTEVLTITVTGAADGDIATVGVPIASQTTGLIWQAYVSGANTVSVSVTNTTVAPIEPATATFRVSVIKY